MGSRVELFVHAVWATALRRPMIAASWKQELYRVIATKCIALDCTPRAIGGIADHVHLLAQIHATTSVAQLLAGVKGASSHAINQRPAPGAAFAWQACYFATSVSPDDVPAVEHYIRDQERHHRSAALLHDFEPPSESS